jgi:alpha-glucoside transport system permease protein
LGLALALLVDRLKGQAVYKSLIFMPMAVSFVGASFIWRFVYETRGPAQPQIGLLSQIAILLGFDPPNWILTQPLNTFLLMVIMVWVQTGFAMVVLSAALKAVPDDVIEAARMDGAHGGRLLFFVTIPMIRNTLIVVLTTVMITTLKVFDIVRTMTGGNFGTQVLANEMYSQSFVQFNNGRGSALATILFLAVLPLVIYNIVQLRRERETR